MIRSQPVSLTAPLSTLDRAVFASVSAMSVFALFSPFFWGLN